MLLIVYNQIGGASDGAMERTEIYDTLPQAMHRYNTLLQDALISRATIYRCKTLATFDRDAALPYDDHKVVYNIIG